MASITWTDVVNHIPSLTSFAVVAAQADVLAFVNTAHTVSELGGETGARLKLARIYLAAHFATAVAVAAGGGGALTQESLGDESRAYASTFSMSTSDLSLTGYGVTYLSLVKTSAARAPFLL